MGFLRKAVRYSVPKLSVNRRGVRFGNHLGGVSSSWSGNPRADIGIGPARMRASYKGSGANQSGYAGSNKYSADSTALPKSGEELWRDHANAGGKIPWEIRYGFWLDAKDKRNDARAAMRKAQGLRNETTVAWVIAVPLFSSFFGVLALIDRYGGARIADLFKHWILFQALPMAILAAITFIWLGYLFSNLESSHSHKYGAMAPDYLIALRAKFHSNVAVASPVTYAVILHTTAFNFWFRAFVISLLPAPISFSLLRVFLSRSSWLKAYAEKDEAKRAEAEKARAENEKARAENEKARAENEKARAENERSRITAIRAFQQKVQQAEKQKSDKRAKVKDEFAEASEKLAEIYQRVILECSSATEFNLTLDTARLISFEHELQTAFTDVRDCLSACQGVLSSSAIADHQSALVQLRWELENKFSFKDL